MNYSAIPKIKQLAQKYGTELNIEESKDGSYVDCMLKAGQVDIYVNVSRFDNQYIAYGIESSLLPRELYPDDIKNKKFSIMDRNDEILRNIELILSKQIIFHPSRSLLNKRRGYIFLEIDGVESKIYQKNDDMVGEK